MSNTWHQPLNFIVTQVHVPCMKRIQKPFPLRMRRFFLTLDTIDIICLVYANFFMVK